MCKTPTFLRPVWKYSTMPNSLRRVMILWWMTNSETGSYHECKHRLGLCLSWKIQHSGSGGSTLRMLTEVIVVAAWRRVRCHHVFVCWRWLAPISGVVNPVSERRPWSVDWLKQLPLSAGGVVVVLVPWSRHGSSPRIRSLARLYPTIVWAAWHRRWRCA